MENDEANLIAAKAFRSRLLGDKKRAVYWEGQLEDLRKPKSPRIEMSRSPTSETSVSGKRSEDGEVEIVSPLDENGMILPTLLKKVLQIVDMNPRLQSKSMRTFNTAGAKACVKRLRIIVSPRCRNPSICTENGISTR